MNKFIPVVLAEPVRHQSSYKILVLDIGGTKIDLAISSVDNNEITFTKKERFQSKDFNSVVELLQHFQYDKKSIDAIAIAVAGPVFDGIAKTTNIDWEINERQLRSDLNISNVFVLNDLEAFAHGISSLSAEDYIVLHKGKNLLSGNRAVIAPGTGLGEAGLFWDGKKHHAFASEGGHCDFGPRTDLEDALLKQLRKKYGHVSWERVLSGPGIWAIYQFLKNNQEVEFPPEMMQMQKTNQPSELVCYCAREGDAVSEQTMNLFYKFLAVECANLAVKYKAVGGIYIAGGLVPNTIDLFNKNDFIHHFYDLGRMRPLLERVPIYCITSKLTALTGAAIFGNNQLNSK